MSDDLIDVGHMWGRIENDVIQEVSTHKPMRGEYVPVRVRTVDEDDALLKRVEELSGQVVKWRELAERAAGIYTMVAHATCTCRRGDTRCSVCLSRRWLADLRAAREGKK